MNSKGLALIVVHGVADQRPGETAQSLVDLLVANGGAEGDRVSYGATAKVDFVLPVRPLGGEHAASAREDATPRATDRKFSKAWRQSRSSDMRAGSVIVPSKVESGGALRRGTAGAPDRGVALTDYLLAKHVENGASVEFYKSSCIQLERVSPACTTPISVYEMYWADLSRLSGALPRIVTELFTMVFRLSKLGRDTVDEACGWRLPPEHGLRHQSAWNLTARLQTLLDWLFANILALLFAHLVLLALVLMVLGVASSLTFEKSLWLHVGVGAGSAALLMLIYAYHHRGERPLTRVSIPAALAAAVCVVALLLTPMQPTFLPWVSGLLLAGVVFFVYDAGLRAADERFPFTRRVGWAQFLLLFLLVLASAGYEVYIQGSSLDWRAFDVGWHATIFGVEVTLLAIKTCWIITGFLLIAWFAAGCFAAREASFEARASLATGRLGLAISLATFLTLTMALWALLTTVVDVAARNVAYTPCVFKFEKAASSNSVVSDPDQDENKRRETDRDPSHNSCLPILALQAELQVGTPGVSPSAPVGSSARLYLRDRFEKSTTVFSLLVVVLLVLVTYLLVMFVPSVLAEMKLFVARKIDRAAKTVADKKAPDEEAEAQERSRTYRLGRWLTVGFKGLDAAVFVLVGVGCAFGVAVAYVFSGVDPKAFGDLERPISDLSRNFLEPLVLTTAGIFALLSTLGGVLSKYLPALRAPLDIALDVDNHFREFPRAAIPRARIFSRYAALLKHIAAQGHDRIVIVAHSQGTVITAELLRYLSRRGSTEADMRNAPAVDHRDTPHPRLLHCEGNQLPSIALLTLGCPLRQLYAARFPTLYRWVLAQRGRVTGPLASDIGVSRWINAYCSGDYVGRWLWSDSAAPAKGDSLGRPMTDTVDPAPFGRKTAYDGFSPMPPAVEPFNSRTELEVCLGFGAHTHYFEPEMDKVAWLVDHLLAPAVVAGGTGSPRTEASSRPSRWDAVLAGVTLAAGILAFVRRRQGSRRPGRP